MRTSRGHVIIPLSVICAFLFNEFIIYYLLFHFSCSWSQEPTSGPDGGTTCLRSLVMSDPHILGNRRGHFFDRLRREWQMHQSFVVADFLFKPDVVLVLGDILDEGLIASNSEFEEYVTRFHSVFPIRSETQSLILVGNHDIGFHDRVLYFEPKLRQRFESAFNTSLVQVRKIAHSGQNYTFVAINSMAMEGDECSLCSAAESQIMAVSRSLSHSPRRPVLLSHFPLFRESDQFCNEPDSADPEEKLIEFRPRIDCISEESSDKLISNLRPGLVLTGHTHSGCITEHEYSGHRVVEHTVASISWRNRADPSFLLISFCPDDILVSKCFVPNEWLIICIYTSVSIAILAYATYSLRTLQSNFGLEDKLFKTA